MNSTSFWKVSKQSYLYPYIIKVSKILTTSSFHHLNVNHLNSNVILIRKSDNLDLSASKIVCILLLRLICYFCYHLKSSVKYWPMYCTLSLMVISVISLLKDSLTRRLVLCLIWNGECIKRMTFFNRALISLIQQAWLSCNALLDTNEAK